MESICCLIYLNAALHLLLYPFSNIFSAPDVSGGSNHPEALQRLIGMELRANPKQLHPFGVGHSQAVYNHELDMGFRYR